jgi:N6-adenosine-specific RNA methylase IME4
MSDLPAVRRRSDLSISELPQAELLARLDQANDALNAAKTLPEVKAVRDKIAAIEGYLRQRERSEAVANEATRIKLRAERRLGQLLRQRPPAKRGRRKQLDSTVLSNSDEVPNLKDLGISLTQSSRWQKVAALPEAVIEAKIDAATEKGEQISAKEVVKQATKEARPNKNPAPPLPDGVFDLIYADPPWQTDLERGDGRDVEKHYPTMRLQEIKDQPVAAVCHRDCVLFLWATSPLLPQALDVMKAWGFTYKTSAVWAKSGKAMGYYFRQDHELLLIGTKGQPGVPEPANRPSSVVQAAKGRHSEKPEVFHELIEQMYPDKQRLELFARKGERPGWTYWGNELGDGPAVPGSGGRGTEDLGEGALLAPIDG